ncbi:hypothetical protein FQA39_LY14211 [Lamprigera yunnana]|nr:hypothetical protein FQA39_LY14211 [Lamprigera yunnana]
MLIRLCGTITNTLKVSIQRIYNDFYYPSVCHFCKEIPEKLQRCSSCKTVGYCSKDHQKLDWRTHKGTCKAIALTTIEPKSNCDFKEWENYRLNIQLKWKTILKRELYPYECQMWMFPRVCAYCYSKSNLTDCASCLNVAYCSEEHKDKHVLHSKFCKSLRLCMDVDLYLAKFLTHPQVDLQQYYGCNKNKIKDMHKLLQIIGVKSDIDCVLKSEMLSLTATISYTMELLTTDSSKCVIHLVGASVYEATTDWTLTSELLFHRWPNIKKISFNLIGPNAQSITKNVKLCETCDIQKRTVFIIVHRKLYHELVNNIETADFVFAFNCGLHALEGENDLWKYSIQFLARNELPFVYTSYTEEEVQRDLDYIRKTIGDIHILETKKNPFSSLRPIRDWCTKDIPVFYINSYLTIIKRKSVNIYL